MSKTICFKQPSLNEDLPLSTDMSWTFIRDYFDSSGSVNDPSSDTMPVCKLSNHTSDILKDIQKHIDIKSTLNNNELTFHGCNAMDFLSKLYDNVKPSHRSDMKYKQYINWVTSQTKDVPCFLVYKSDPKALLPTKERYSDVGWDLTVIQKVKDISPKTSLYDTCIKVCPSHGFYTKIYPRSSISKSGYMMSNSTGIIDPNYLGTIKIALTKVDDSMPDLKLPFRCAQMIVEKYNHVKMIEVDSENKLGETERGDGGFGSTG